MSTKIEEYNKKLEIREIAQTLTAAWILRQPYINNRAKLQYFATVHELALDNTRKNYNDWYIPLSVQFRKKIMELLENKNPQIADIFFEEESK